MRQCSGLKGGKLSLSLACRDYHLIGCQGLAFEGGAAELEEEEVLVELGLGAELHWRTTAPQSEETSPPGRILRLLMHAGYKLRRPLRKGLKKEPLLQEKGVQYQQKGPYPQLEETFPPG